MIVARLEEYFMVRSYRCNKLLHCLGRLCGISVGVAVAQPLYEGLSTSFVIDENTLIPNGAMTLVIRIYNFQVHL